MTDRFFSRLILLIIITLLALGADIWMRKPAKYTPGANKQYYKIVSMPTPDSLFFAGEQVPLDLFYVKESLDREIAVNTYWHSSTLLLIRKSTRWFPLFDSILESHGVPEDFKYLSVIESGLSNVVSPANAVGFWQFLKGTGKDFGLEIDNDVDERYNVVKSTEAACLYLKDSYEKFGNWTLVAAAYNAGNNGISKFMESQQANSYYDLLLSDETSRYVYRILAVKMIFENPEQFGFFVDEQDYYKPIPVKYVVVNGKIDNWADFAKEQGISYKLLKYFNPWLRSQDLNNRRKKTYYISIPLPPYDMTHNELMNRPLN